MPLPETYLTNKAQKLLSVQADIHALLPSQWHDIIKVANVYKTANGNGWVIKLVCGNSAIYNRLRFQTNNLLSALKQQEKYGTLLQHIEVKCSDSALPLTVGSKPRMNAPIPSKRRPKQMTAETAASIIQQASEIKDPRLRNAVLKLAQRHQEAPHE